MSTSPYQFTVDTVRVTVHRTGQQLGDAVAAQVAGLVREAVASRGVARVIIGTGPSQATFIAALVARQDVPWQDVEVFHMDEYLGMPVTHPASFRRWLRTHLTDQVPVRASHELEGDAADTDAEIARYTALLEAAPIDVSCVGFGENGHLAFNDPPVADFADPATVKRVMLDERCRLQQVGEGHFPSLEATPATALTVTVPALLRARTVVACVPERRKAAAVRDALEGPIATSCPASALRTHPRAFVHLDLEAASLLAAARGLPGDDAPAPPPSTKG
jgi:glucosamine-6-phosphate deaminase